MNNNVPEYHPAVIKAGTNIAAYEWNESIFNAHQTT